MNMTDRHRQKLRTKERKPKDQKAARERERERIQKKMQSARPLSCTHTYIYTSNQSLAYALEKSNYVNKLHLLVFVVVADLCFLLKNFEKEASVSIKNCLMFPSSSSADELGNLGPSKLLAA
jgi:hypothetical protein